MYLVVGANGFLGSYLIKNILERTNDVVLAADLNCPEENQDRVRWIKCDIGDEGDVLSLHEQTEGQELKILFLAAYHHPDSVLKNPRIAWKINIVALAKFLDVFSDAAILYYPSTEVVYGESDGSLLKEDAPLKPLSRYGEFKRTAESLVNLAGFNVVRFPVLMGRSLFPDRPHFTDKILESLKNGHSIEMFCDQYRSLLDFDTAAKTVISLTEHPDAKKHPVVNIAGDERLSKYDYACRLADKYGLNKNLIKPVFLNSPNSVFTEKRANETLLDNTLIKQILNLKELKIRI